MIRYGGELSKDKCKDCYGRGKLEYEDMGNGLFKPNFSSTATSIFSDELVTRGPIVSKNCPYCEGTGLDLKSGLALDSNREQFLGTLISCLKDSGLEVRSELRNLSRFKDSQIILENESILNFKISREDYTGFSRMALTVYLNSPYAPRFYVIYNYCIGQWEKRDFKIIDNLSYLIMEALKLNKSNE